ncbi:MAG: hypothetical protein HYR90_02450 [Candidatus Andersenbacteria bacterium]|nr:hypothetical protein [Candidatus Andersenbacteria bacterium]MBI3251019.1 hypothetical protein [Candidatus Andersenbacteria bacterium]
MKKILTFIVTSSWLLVTPFFAYAAIIPPCDPVPGKGNSCGVNDLFQLLVNIYDYLLGLAAIVAVLMIVWAGFRILIFYWSEQPESDLEAAKNTIRRAIFGLIIILTAYLVVATVVFSLFGLDPGGPVGKELQKRGLVAP